MKMKRIALPLLALILMLVSLVVAAQTGTPETEPPAGAPAQEAANPEAAPMDSVMGAFSTVNLAGEPVDSNIFAQAKLTMVNVWATFCGYCIDEMPDLAKLDEEYEDLQVLGVLGDAGSAEAPNPANLQLGIEIVEKTGAAYYANILPDEQIGANLMQYIYSYPTTFFVDQNGQIVGQAIAGAMRYDDWKKVIDERMGQIAQG